MAVIGGNPNRILTLKLILIGAGYILGACTLTSKNLMVCEVQGKGEVSSYIGKKVTLQGLVSLVLEGGTPDGFFLIDQQCPVNEGKSRGIFVEVVNFENQVHLGDEVRVKGVIEEVGGETRIKSAPVGLEILSLGNEIPPGINLAEEFSLHPDSFEYENWEGMLVSLPEGEFLDGFQYPGIPHIRPVFKIDPEMQMVCLHNPSIILQLFSSLDFHSSINLSEGDLLQNLSGVLRQNTTGYMLELTESFDFKDVRKSGSPNLVGGNTSSGSEVSETQVISSSGTPTFTISGTPISTIIPSVTIIPSLTYYPVNLLISEVYPNPRSKEPEGEWVEIYNPEPYAQPLTGIKLGDETSSTGKEGMLRFPDGYYIKSQEVLVISNQAKAFFSEFGFLPDFEMKDSDSRIPDLLPYDGWGRSGIQFSNSGDEVLLLDPWDGVVDLLVYGNSSAAGFPDPPPAPNEGFSLERYPPERDQDRGGDWREREEVSPGRLDRSPPTQAVLPSLEPSFTFTPSPQESSTVTASVIPTVTATTEGMASSTPTAVAIPSLTPSMSMTDIISPTPEPSMTPTISPTPSPSLTEVVEITFTPAISVSPSWTITPQITISPTGTGTTLPEITLTGTYDLTDTPEVLITPSQTPTVTATTGYGEDPDILLNEIHADPDLILGDANNDGVVHSNDDEFLEFVNSGLVDLDLSGWSIADSLKTRFIFPEATTLKSGCAVVVFGGGNPQGRYGGSLIFSAGSLSLNNSGDIISLSDNSGEERLFYSYGSEGGENQSLTRSPDISGGLPMVLHSEADGSNEDIYSPGFTVDGLEFGICP